MCVQRRVYPRISVPCYIYIKAPTITELKRPATLLKLHAPWKTSACLGSYILIHYVLITFFSRKDYCSRVEVNQADELFSVCLAVSRTDSFREYVFCKLRGGLSILMYLYTRNGCLVGHVFVIVYYGRCMVHFVQAMRGVYTYIYNILHFKVTQDERCKDILYKTVYLPSIYRPIFRKIIVTLSR